MSLQIEISTEELSKSFLVFDCTGKYSGDNKTGYGVPNYTIESIDSYTLKVQPPSATEKYPFSIDLTDALPNNDETGVEIQPSQVGQTDGCIESGQWKFKAEVVFNLKTGGQKIVNGYHSVVFTKNIACCVDSRVTTLTDACLHDDRQKAIIALSNLLEGVYGDIKCGLYDKADKTIEYMKGQCKCPEC